MDSLEKFRSLSTEDIIQTIKSVNIQTVGLADGSLQFSIPGFDLKLVLSNTDPTGLYRSGGERLDHGMWMLANAYLKSEEAKKSSEPS